MPRWLSNPGTFGYGKAVFDRRLRQLAGADPEHRRGQEAGPAGRGDRARPSPSAPPASWPNIAAVTGDYQAAAQAIGLKVVLKSVSAQNYINFFIDPKARAGVDGFLTVNYGDYADPAALLSTLVLPGGSQNFDHFNNPQIISAHGAGPQHRQPGQAGRAGGKAEKLAMQQLPWIPNVQPTSVLTARQGPHRRRGLVRLHVRALGQQPGRDRLSRAAEPVRWRSSRAGWPCWWPACSWRASSSSRRCTWRRATRSRRCPAAGPCRPSSIAVLEARYHLNEPFLAQYWYWLEQRAAREPGDLDHAAGERVHADRVPDLDHRRAGPVRVADDRRAVGIGLGMLSGLRPGASTPARW